jgi:hypothetical protein
MRVVVLTLLALLTARLATPSAATAQYHRLTDAVVVGGTLAAASSSAAILDGGPELGGLIEIPLGDTLRLRGEAAAGRWHSDGYPYAGIAASDMWRHRLTLSVLHSRRPPSPAWRLSGYAGGGAGVYLYRFPSRADGGAWGLHGVAGVEYLPRTMRSRWIVAGEVQLHGMGQPKAPGEVTSIPMLTAHVAAVVKYRLP